VNGFAGTLKRLREKAGMTQKQLAEKAGLSAGSVANLEQGFRGPAWDTVQALALALGVDCRAFTEAVGSAEQAPAHRGRPAKSAETPVAKKTGRRTKKR
jgi:transcriptional regulator with XRE-family HTH domain